MFRSRIIDRATMNGRISAAPNQNMSPLLLTCNFHTLLSKFSVLLKERTREK